MKKRTPLSKKIRFEVFKRDSFRCQYCGRSAPDVILEVDHIIPVADGGDNDLMNLVTSCRDCNRGKGKRELSDSAILERQKAELESLNERREQLKMMIAWREELSNQSDLMIDQIESMVRGFRIDDFPGFNPYARNKIHNWIKEFGFSEVMASTEIAYRRYYLRYANEIRSYEESKEYSNIAFHKIGGICYNRKKQKEYGDG